MLDKNDLPADSLTMGGALGLWDIARNKIVTLPVYVIYLKQAKDKELVKYVSNRIGTVRKQIGRIQQLFKEHGFDAPTEPNWDKKMNNDAFVLSGSILDDEEIAMGIKEHLRSVLGLETEALRNSTIPEVRNLIFDLMKQGNSDYSKIIKIQKERKWMDNPPVLIQQ